MASETVFRVQHLVRRGSAWGHAVTDLIFVDGHPIAVLEWGGVPGSEHPHVSVRLDPKRLQELHSGSVTHLYDGPIEDPREGS